MHVGELPEFAILMARDRSNLPRCLLWRSTARWVRECLRAQGHGRRRLVSRPAVRAVWVGTQDEGGLQCFCYRVTRVSMCELPPLPPG